MEVIKEKEHNNKLPKHKKGFSDSTLVICAQC